MVNYYLNPIIWRGLVECVDFCLEKMQVVHTCSYFLKATKINLIEKNTLTFLNW